MVYPGNPELSPQAQERVVTAFRQVITKLQEGHQDEAMIALEFVLRLDPGFGPASTLQQQLASGGASIDLAAVLGQLHPPSTDEIDGLLVEAVDDFNSRSFLDARDKVNRVLVELPGHDEARQLRAQIEEALERETEIGQLLTTAREALERGDARTASQLVTSAQALDPHHPGIEPLLEELPGPTPPPVPDRAVAVETAPVGTPPELEASPAPADEEFSFEGGGELDLGGSEEASPSWESGKEASDFDPWAGGREEVVSFAEAGEAPATDDLAPLFDAGEEAPGEGLFGEEEGGEAAPEADEVQALLDQGGAAFDEGDFLRAIDTWSRIYLVDPANQEASRRIDLARARHDELLSRLEATLADALDAEREGNLERAAELADEILTAMPGHVEAAELKERLALEGGAPAPRPAVPAAPPAGEVSELPELEDDLFTDDGAASQPAAEVDDSWVPELREAAPAAAAVAPRPQRAFPWPIIAGAVGAIVVLLIGAWFGSQLLSGKSDDQAYEALSQVLEQSEELFSGGRTDEAIHMLREYPVTSDLDRQRIDRRLAKYEQALAPPTPTPEPKNLDTAEGLLAEGRWLAALAEVESGLKAHPRDAGLEALKGRILKIDGELATLHRATTANNEALAVQVAKELADRHPRNAELAAELRRHLFNAALVELRSYGLTGAEAYLSQLARLEPDDEEVQRVLAFIVKYKARPVDMQLKIFIGSLSPR